MEPQPTPPPQEGSLAQLSRLALIHLNFTARRDGDQSALMSGLSMRMLIPKLPIPSRAGDSICPASRIPSGGNNYPRELAEEAWLEHSQRRIPRGTRAAEMTVE